MVILVYSWENTLTHIERGRCQETGRRNFVTLPMFKVMLLVVVLQGSDNRSRLVRTGFFSK